MTLLQFYGASDDLFYVDLNGRSYEEFDGNATLQIVAGEYDEQNLLVMAEYGRVNACWTVGVCQIDEDADLPNWKIWYSCGGPSRGYSVVLNIDVPDNFMLKEYKKGST